MPITEVVKVLKRIKKEPLENDTWPEQFDINLRDTVTSNYNIKR